MNKVKLNKEVIFTVMMFFIAFICMMTFAVVQPFGDGPDEINRYKIVQFIFENGGLPAGTNPAVLIAGYGGSYAFQPILTYIIDGYLLRALSFLSLSLTTQVLVSRMVNICFGLIMAGYVRKMSKLLFDNQYTAWAFTLAIVFLPQNVFIHTYVNTDSMGLLSVAIIIYAILKGMKDNYSFATCLHLSIGIILCALSYYNCYGIILCAMFLFLFQFFYKKEFPDGKLKTSYHHKMLYKKGSIVIISVLLGISWWFIRNAILYHGDFLALNARQVCAAATCREEYNPYTRDTYKRLGIPVLTMIFGTDYYTLVWKSFIAMFGPMIIPTHHYIYMSFKYLFISSLIGLVIPAKANVMSEYRKDQKIAFSLTMVAAMIIPAFLAIYYSYTWEFQPQGRYFLPMLIPFIYFLAIGIQKLFYLMEISMNRINEKAARTVSFLLYHFLYAFLTLSLLYSVFIAMLRYYNK